MGRAPCCDKIGLKKGPWTAEEDEKLTAYINEHGHGSWRALPKKAGLLRCGKSCRLRWTNYLRPDIKRGEFTASEEQTIIQLHALLGNRWSAIASHLPKRTDNEIKNYWNTHLKKRLLKMGIDPVTHKPKVDNDPNSPSSSILNDSHGSNNTTSMSHMAQWESVRLEAEARLAREAEMRAKGLWTNVNPASTPSASTTTTTTTTNNNLATSAPTPWTTILSSSSSSSSWNKAAIATSFTDLLSSKLNSASLQPDNGLNDSSNSALVTPKAETDNNKASWTTMNAVDLMTVVQNWEKSLQGQAGLMWPDSWHRLSGDMGELQESSSCSSPHYHHGSPTSTLSSLDQAPKQQLSASTNLEESSHQPRKLSWSEHILHLPLENVVADSSNMSGFCGMPSLQAFMEMDDGLSDMKREIEEEAANPILASVTNSSSFLSELEFVSEDISSSHQSSSNSRGLDDDQNQHQVSYSALLNEEDYADCDWDSVMKEVEGSGEPIEASF